MRRLICILTVLAVLFTSCVGSAVFAAPADDDAESAESAETSENTDTAVSSPDTVASSSDAAYFDRIAVIPIDVEIPYFYQQVLNIAGMYIFSTPDGTVHKRIYGALDGVYGWYIPVGPEHTVSADSTPIDTGDDIRFYEEAVAAYKAENPGEQQFTGILPPEDGTYEITALFGYSIGDIFKYSLLGAGGLCVLIIFGFAIKKLTGRRRSRH